MSMSGVARRAKRKLRLRITIKPSQHSKTSDLEFRDLARAMGALKDIEAETVNGISVQSVADPADRP